MSADTRFGLNDISPDGEQPPGTSVSIKDMFLVPTGTHLVPHDMGKIVLPPIDGDSSAISAAVTLLAITERQVSRIQFVEKTVGGDKNATTDTEERARGQAFQVFPPINGTPQRESALGNALAERLTEYGVKTERWPRITDGRVVGLSQVSSQESFRPATAGAIRGGEFKPTSQPQALPRGK